MSWFDRVLDLYIAGGAERVKRTAVEAF